MNIVLDEKKLIAGFDPYKDMHNIFIGLVLAQTLKNITSVYIYKALIHNSSSLLFQQGIQLFRVIVWDLWLISHFR